MTGPLSSVQRRFGEIRPGLQLIAVEIAALPVTVIGVDVLAQEKKKLPITEEFTLRFVAETVDTPKTIANYLGLDEVHVLEAAAAQLSAGNLRRISKGSRLALTASGVEVVRTLASAQPTLRQLPIAFDRLTWSIADYPPDSLIEKKEAEDRGMIVLPASKNARIGVEDVTPGRFNRLLRTDLIEVLRIHRVTTRKHRYLPVQLLVYADASQTELELALCIEDDLSEEHGLALDATNAVTRLGLKLGAKESRPVLEDALERIRVAEPSTKEPAGIESPAAAVASTAMVRSVSVFEHPDLLHVALTTAKRRLLIISPWIRNGVVSTDFLSKLEHRLRAGVIVTIAHGYGDDTPDDQALRRLNNLSFRFENFKFVRLKNTHAKILVFDDHWVATSFNWLSFRGDSDRTYRMEEGTLVSIPDRVSNEYDRYLRMIDEQQV